MIPNSALDELSERGSDSDVFEIKQKEERLNSSELIKVSKLLEDEKATRLMLESKRDSLEEKVIALENEINILIEQQSHKEIEYERIYSSFKRIEREKEEFEQKSKELKKVVESNQSHFAIQTKTLENNYEKQINTLVKRCILIKQIEK